MPTILLENGFRFYFYSNENHEPCHIYIEKGDAYEKIWLERDFEIWYLLDFTKQEIKKITTLTNKNIIHFRNKWNAYFSK